MQIYGKVRSLSNAPVTVPFAVTVSKQVAIAKRRKEKERGMNKTKINKIGKIKLSLNPAGIILKPVKLLKWCGVRKLDSPFL